LQVFASTRGAQDHLIDFDAPNFLGSLFRVRATFEYEAANVWPYYGVGSRTLAPLAFPGAPGKTFGSLSDYNDAQRAVQPDGTTYGLYNAIGFQRPTLQLGVERLLLGGVLRPLVGFGFAYNKLTDFTGQQTDATLANGSSTRAPEATTLYAADCAAHRILGCGGGFDNVLRLALSLDTRDFEPDPNDGVYAELSTEIGTKALGSQYDYVRTMLSVRGFYSPIPKIADLVIAVRGLYEVQSSGTPFFSQVWLPFIDDNHEGLGGFRTLRGYDQDRFVGPIIALTNYELRWTFARFKVLNQGFGLMAVPFLDMGRVFDDVGQTSFADWKRAQGMGLRIAWNEATILMADYGFSSEGTGLYLNFNHIF
jgi:outer membrane protein assembly factor BamA